MVLPGFAHRAWQYQIGMAWNYVGMVMYIIAFFTPAWYMRVEPAPDGNGYRRVTAGLWQVCDKGFQRCRDIPAPVADWMHTTRVFQTAGLILFLMAGIVTTLHILSPPLSYGRWARLLELKLLLAGIISFSSVCVFGTHVQELSPNKEMSWAFMLAIVSSLSALVSFINVFQGRFDTDGGSRNDFVFEAVETSAGCYGFTCAGFCGKKRDSESLTLGAAGDGTLHKGDYGGNATVVEELAYSDGVQTVDKFEANVIEVCASKTDEMTSLHTVDSVQAVSGKIADMDDVSTAAMSGAMINGSTTVEALEVETVGGYEGKTKEEIKEGSRVVETKTKTAIKKENGTVEGDGSKPPKQKTGKGKEGSRVKGHKDRAAEDPAINGHKGATPQTDEAASVTANVSADQCVVFEDTALTCHAQKARDAESAAALVLDEVLKTATSIHIQSLSELAGKASQPRAASPSSERRHSLGDSPTELGVSEAEKIAYYEGGDIPPDEVQGKPAAAETVDHQEECEPFLGASA